MKIQIKTKSNIILYCDIEKDLQLSISQWESLTSYTKLYILNKWMVKNGF